MNINWIRYLLAALFPLLLGSCGQQASSPKAISLDALSFAEWDKQLSAYQGNVVVADLWATWCLPCIERFPKMVDLHHKYADSKVSFISINFDDSQDGESLQKAENFLKEVKAEFDNFYFNENLIDAFEYMEVIALPVVVIYSGDGREALRLTNTDPNNQFTGADIEKAIDKLLAGG
jgi:thiol-disulfide isomerase/thioredoxin